MTQSKPTPILSLDTLEERVPVRFLRSKDQPEGEIYYMMSPGRFGMREMNRLQSYARTVQDWTDRELTDEEADDAEQKLNAVVRMILPEVPEDILIHLNVFEKIRAMNHFFQTAGGGQLGEVTAPVDGNRIQRRRQIQAK